MPFPDMLGPRQIRAVARRLGPLAQDVVFLGGASLPLLVTDAVADGRQLVVVIDTGSEVTVGNAALRRVLSRRQLREEGPVELISVTGEKMIGNSTSLSRLELGEVRLEQLNIVFAEAHTFSQMGLTDVPALLLGMNALKAFDRVSIDFAGKKLRVRLPDSSRVDSSLRLAAR